MNKTLRNALILSACAIALVIASVSLTFAYFTSQATVSNTFTVGKVAITLDETVTDENGVAVTPAAKTTTGNNYRLVPSRTYTKDPTVTVKANSEDSYIFVEISNGISAVEDSADTIASQILANNWTLLSGNVYYKTYTKTSTDTALPVFETFTVADGASDTALAAVGTVDITAYAIQQEGLATASEAWAALNPN